MRRIYESKSLHRDDDDPFSPTERDERRPTSFLSKDGGGAINWDALSHAFVPVMVRDRAISVTVNTDKQRYAPGETVHIRIDMENHFPIPVTITTQTPIHWTWAVDGHTDASRISQTDPPDERSTLHFQRGERKRFERQWPQMIQTSEHQWQRVDAGEHTISATVNATDARQRGLSARTTVEIG